MNSDISNIYDDSNNYKTDEKDMFIVNSTFNGGEANGGYGGAVLLYYTYNDVLIDVRPRILSDTFRTRHSNLFFASSHVALDIA